MAPPYAIFEKGPGVKRTFYKASFDPSTGKNIPPPHGGKWRSLDSKYDVSHKMLLNKVSMLGGERVEQDLLVRNSYIDRQTKGKKETFEENIYEFERVKLPPAPACGGAGCQFRDAHPDFPGLRP